MSAAPQAHSPIIAGLTRLIAVWNLLILLVVLMIAFSLLIPDTFLTPFTFQSLINTRSINAMLALAVMIPLTANQFDLSTASVLGLSQVLAIGLQVNQGLPWPLACAICLLMGATVGLANGILVVRFGINSFIATLGSGTLLLGLSQWYTGGRQIVGALPEGFTALSDHFLNTGIPIAAIYVIVIAVVLWVVFDYLPLGRFLYVIGDAPRAAELNAIPIGRYITLAFVASGVISAFAGIVMEAQMQVGQSTVGQELMLPAFTGALLGTTAIRPGRPNVWGTIVAVAVLAVAVAGLTQLGAPFFVENLFNGAMLVLAVGLAVATQKRRERRRAREADTRAALAAPEKA
ncbi:MAG: ABC transporter permease [Thermomicrobiales bacterium]|nr:ABC transporter permease [Thermomicrobiales bacterium]